MSCWCRTAITIISISRRCRGSPPRIARASSRRSATTPSCAITIPRSRPKAYDWDDRVDLGAGVAVTLVPTRHWSARSLSDRNMSLWASFVIETPAGRIYFVGDSGYGDGRHFRDARERHGPFRLAILPIGAYEPRWFMRDQHMNPAEAVQAFVDCGAELALAPPLRHVPAHRRGDRCAARSRSRRRCRLPEFRPSASAPCGPGEVWQF